LTCLLAGQRLPLAFTALLLVLALRAAPAHAAGNRLYVDPASATLAANGTTVVDIVGEPGDNGLAAWVLDLVFDPNVVTTSNEQCDPVDTPAGAAGAVGCEVADTNDDGAGDTVKAYGGVIFTGSGKGFSQTTVLASVAFTAAPGATAGACSPLTLRITAYTDQDGTESNPEVIDGEVCLPGPDRTPGPERTLPPPPSPGATQEPGQTLAPGETATIGPNDETPAVAPGVSRSTGAGSGQTISAGVGGLASQENGSGGPGAAVWVLIGLGVAGLAAAAAYAFWRARQSGA